MRAVSDTAVTATSGDSVITLISHDTIRAKGGAAMRGRLTNESAYKGWYSLDNEATWARLNANFDHPLNDDGDQQIHSVKVKRIASGTDVTGLYAEVWS